MELSSSRYWIEFRRDAKAKSVKGRKQIPVTNGGARSWNHRFRWWLSEEENETRVELVTCFLRDFRERERDSIGVFFLGLRRRRRRRSDYGRYFHFWPLYIGTNETDPARFLWSVKCPNISMSRSRITNMPLFDFYFFFSNTNYNLQNYWIL